MSSMFNCTEPGCDKKTLVGKRECEKHAKKREAPSESKPISRQRVIIRKCNAKLLVPSKDGHEVVFMCQDDAGHNGTHVEHGSVDMDNGTARSYTIYWNDLGVHTTRKRPSKARKPGAK